MVTMVTSHCPLKPVSALITTMNICCTGERFVANANCLSLEYFSNGVTIR